MGELKLRGMCERILIVAPANLAFQWQRPTLCRRFIRKTATRSGFSMRCY